MVYTEIQTHASHRNCIEYASIRLRRLCVIN